MAYWRNIFASEDEHPEWAAAVSNFPNKVPRFKVASECIDFIKSYCSTSSNPLEPNLFHSISTLTDWNQINQILLPKIKEYRRRWPTNQYKSHQTNDASATTTHSESQLHEYIETRLNLPIHNFLCTYSVENTLKYLFFHMRCGIYVMIRNKQVAIFAPFVNKNYVNTWGDALTVENDTVEAYYTEKMKYFRDENYLSEKNKFWANGNIICNLESEGSGCPYWGDQFLFQIKDMLAETCRLRDVPDCEFFINKRDYPQLKYHSESSDSVNIFNNSQQVHHGFPAEPYGFIYDKDDRDPSVDIALQEHAYKSYAPILSFYTSTRFADIPLPPSEDWESATGEIFPVSFSSSNESGELVVQGPRELFTESNLKKFNCAWEDKKNTAFFRGTATGGGITTETNQRLHLAQLSYLWNLSKDPLPKLDAKIVGWNPRDKKIAGSKMNFIRPDQFKFEGGKQNYVEIYKQSSFKYLIYAEGHCAACRYGFMMLLGSVILKVESKCVADQLWYFPLLRPYYDHVPVQADLSDLEKKIDWCRANDDKCREIAANAKALYEKHISRDGILDYMLDVFRGISLRWRDPPTWAGTPPDAREAPRRSGDFHSRMECCNEGLCGYCEEVNKRKQNTAANALASNVKTKEQIDQERVEKARKLRERARMKATKSENTTTIASIPVGDKVDDCEEEDGESSSKRIKIE